MNLKISKEPVDSSRYNIKLSENFSLDYPLVTVRFEEFNWLWIPKYSEIVEIVRLLLTYKNCDWFRMELKNLLKEEDIGANI